MNKKIIMTDKRLYLQPHTNIIKMETNYGVMENRSIGIDPNTPADNNGGNAKQFDMTDDMWNDNHEEDIDIFK